MLSACNSPASMLSWIFSQERTSSRNSTSGELSSSVVKHADCIGAIHLVGVKIFPDAIEIAHTLAEILRIYRQRRGIERPCRRSANHRKRIMRVARQEFGDRLEHADLISGTRATAGQYQPYALSHRV